MNPEKFNNIPQPHESDDVPETPPQDYRINVGKYAGVALGVFAATAGAAENNKPGMENWMDQATKVEATDSSLEVVDGVELKTSGFKPNKEEALMIVKNLKLGSKVDLASISIMFKIKDGKGSFIANIKTANGRLEFMSTSPKNTNGSPEEISEMIRAEFN